MFKGKDFRDVSIAVLALGTAYGLGILSCVYWELKFLATCSNHSKNEKGS